MAYGFIKPFYFRACNFENIITVRGTVTIFIGCPPGSADGSYIVFDNTGFDFMVGIQVGMPEIRLTGWFFKIPNNSSPPGMIPRSA